MKTYSLIILVFILACTTSQKLNFSGDLEIGVEESGTLNEKEPKSYQLQLDSNTYLYGFVNQITVDAVVNLYDADDELIRSFDSPARGPEPFSYEIDKTGTYRLEVAPFEETSGE